MKQVIKRDGKIEDFKETNIFKAIKKATSVLPKENHLTDEEILRVVNFVKENVSSKDLIEVEEIQNLVEQGLMKNNYFEVAKEYILSRHERDKKRFRKFEVVQEMEEKLNGANVENQNANLDEASFGGRSGESASVWKKELALDYYISPKFAKNHLNNRIYIHDLDSYAVGMHNCCKKTTKFLTTMGVCSFEDFSDGEVINVFTHTGEVKEATVKKYGMQRLNKITFKRGNTEVVEYFTANHRWLLNNGTVTENLKKGDVILKTVERKEFDFDKATAQEKYYWCLGFVLGDGTEACRWSHGKKNENIKFVRLRLCGDKIKYSKRFEALKHSEKEMYNGDLYLTFSSNIDFRKKMPDLSTLTINEKRALFEGLYAADGTQKKVKSIYTSSEEIASFIEEWCPVFGYYILSEKDLSGEKTNYGIREFGKVYTFTNNKNTLAWKVKNIELSDIEEVWCLEVKDNHSFILPNGIITGNCLSVPMDEMLKKGFKTRQANVRPAGSINTAFQLIAVLFQLQSLQQFGGVSATHLDWTLVPYVRKSFMKHFIDGLKYVEGKTDEEIKEIVKDILEE